MKQVSDLSPKDFKEHPIWGWHDEDGDSPLVMPINETEIISGAKTKHNVLFISSEFMLHDGTRIEGSIGVVLSQRWTYLLSFFKENEIFSFSLNPHPKLLVTIEDLEIWIGKSVDQISPIRYMTPYYFSDGSAIAGEIDLLQI